MLLENWYSLIEEIKKSKTDKSKMERTKLKQGLEIRKRAMESLKRKDESEDENESGGASDAEDEIPKLTPENKRQKKDADEPLSISNSATKSKKKSKAAVFDILKEQNEIRRKELDLKEKKLNIEEKKNDIMMRMIAKLTGNVPAEDDQQKL